MPGFSYPIIHVHNSLSENLKIIMFVDELIVHSRSEVDFISGVVNNIYTIYKYIFFYI